MNIAPQSKYNLDTLQIIFSIEELQIIKAIRNKAMQLTVIGYVTGKSPTQLALKQWAASVLHETMETCTIVGSTFSKVTFSSLEGIQYTFNTPVSYEGKEISSPLELHSFQYRIEKRTSSLHIKFGFSS